MTKHLHTRDETKGKRPLPKRLVAGVVATGVASLTAMSADYPTMPEGERVAFAATCAVLALLGIGLALWGFLIWRGTSGGHSEGSP